MCWCCRKERSEIAVRFHSFLFTPFYVFMLLNLDAIGVIYNKHFALAMLFNFIWFYNVNYQALDVSYGLQSSFGILL